MPGIPYHHVDVFADRPLSGNGLTIFPACAGFDTAFMQLLTQEMRQFESIFLWQLAPTTFRARVFTMDEELDFAGHPVLGAAALLHQQHAPQAPAMEWQLALNATTVAVRTQRHGAHYRAEMVQGPAEFGATLPPASAQELVATLGLDPAWLAPGCPVQVVSTGLPYLLVPLQQGIGQAAFGRPGLAAQLAGYSAKFLGLLEVPTRTIRTGDNLGRVEDVATGSLAGPAGAYLVRYAAQPPDAPIVLHQGEFAGRPSQLRVTVRSRPAGPAAVEVNGDVHPVAHGWLAEGIAPVAGQEPPGRPTTPD